MLIGNRDVFATEMELDGPVGSAWVPLRFRYWIGGKNYGSYEPQSSLLQLCLSMKRIVCNNGCRSPLTLGRFSAHDLILNYFEASVFESEDHQYRQVAIEEGWAMIDIDPEAVVCPSGEVVLVDGEKYSRLIINDNGSELVESIVESGAADDVLLRTCEALWNWYEAVAIEDRRVLIGDRNLFAVEGILTAAILVEDGEPEFNCWVNGRCLESFSFFRYGGQEQLREFIMSECPRTSEVLWEMTAHDAFYSYVNTVDWGLECHQHYQVAQCEKWRLFRMPPVSPAGNESTILLLLNGEPGARVIMYDEKHGIMDVYLESGYVDKVLRQTLALMDEWSKLLPGA